ncbi:LuxR C-terminal-related transcriptional regulator [Cohnella hongkongensis]|uniref:LuxR C-terminal-related transcriptional regulator n=1 Tax=Cohnella hongkongensis TaxID=178337 RepID=A0ABV9F8Q9_9BACL
MTASAFFDGSLRLLRAKLHPPAPIAQPLFRERLHSELNAAWQRKLTLIAAPAGYGKTALLQCWTSRLRQPVAWLRLDPGDDDLRRFLLYLLHALPFPSEAKRARWTDRIREEPAAGVALEPESVAADWIAELDRLERDHLLLIDGAESIRNPEIVRFLSLFLRYSPPQLHVVLSGRRDIDIGTAWSEADGGGLLSAEDLALTEHELLDYVSRHASVRLTEAEVADLISRTQGWFVGVNAYLPLIRNRDYARGEPNAHNRAAQYTTTYFRHLMRHDDPSSLLPALTRLSVAAQQSEPLARLLTDALDSRPTLAALSKDGWYLYPDRHRPGEFVFHPMFAHFLQRTLREASEDVYETLKLTCALYEEERGQLAYAVEHALEGGHRERAARMLLQHASDLLRDHNLQPLLEQFAEAELLRHPGLAVMYADTLIHARRINAAERIVDLLSGTLGENPKAAFSPTGEKLSGYVAALRSMIHFSRRETELGLHYMAQAAEELEGPGKLHRHSLYFHPYTASLLRGKYGHYGVLKSARATCEFGMPRWGRQDTAYAVMLICMGECGYEEGRLKQAEAYLQSGLQLGLDLDNPGLFVPAYLAWSQLKYSRGEKEAAWAALREARHQLLRRGLRESLTVVDAGEVRLRIREQDIRHVRNWLRTAPIRLFPAVPHDRIFEALVLLRAYVWDGKTSEALALGEQLLHIALLTNHPKDLIEVRLMLAQIYRKQGNVQRALEKLDGALAEAYAHGYVQLILDEGAALGELLAEYRRLSRQRGNPALAKFAAKLLKSMPYAEKTQTASAPLASALTRQEQRVLQLLAEGASNRTIAEVLAISPETAKRHCRHVYRKLGVANRKEVSQLVSAQQSH